MYYFPNKGEITSQAEFINFYDQCYYLYVSPSKEKEIEEILKGSKSLNKQNIIKILEWKTGGKYDNAIKRLTNPYGSISYTTICQIEEAVKTQKRDKIMSETEAKNLLKTLLKFDGIGPVYAITLLYFITRGQYPIYDKFAHIAIVVIYNQKQYGSIIYDRYLNRNTPLSDGPEQTVYLNSIDLKEKGSNEPKGQAIDKLFSDYHDHYLTPLNTLFHCEYGKDFNTDRRIDRALWVYGHLFNENERNKERT